MRGIKYVSLQLKRFFGAVPYVLLLSALLLLCLGLAFSQTAKAEADKMQKYELGIVGDVTDTYLKLGLAALENFDNTRFAIHLQFLDADAAQKALENRELNAYIIIPDGFIEDAMHGDVGKLTFVTLPTPTSAVDYVKDELLSVISTVLVESQKGTYAAAEVGREYASLSYGKTATAAMLSYVDLILSRGKLYTVETTGYIGGLSLLASVLCGMLLFFASLFSIGFAHVFAKNDTFFHRLLAASRFGAVRQVISEYVAFLVAFGFSAALLLGLLFGIGGEALSTLTGQHFGPRFFVSLAFVFAALAAMQFLLYEWTEGITAGVLSQFLVSVTLCYFSGCFYPIYFFPEIAQRIAPYLPMGAAHSLLASALTGHENRTAVLVLIMYLIVFLLLGVLLRYRRQTERGGDAA